jgi:hypothetical protein
MALVKLTLLNFSYYAFNPGKKALNPSDRKIAFVITILLGFTLGVGHLMCAVVYALNKDRITKEIDSALISKL